MLLFALACSGITKHPEPADPEDSGPPVDTDTEETADTDDSVPDSTVDTDETGETDETGDTDDTAQPTPGPAVMLFIGDGMGFEHVRGGGLYANGAEGTLAMEGLRYHGNLRTASTTGVTDSAAGATALGAGVKTHNGYVGMDRDGVPLTSVISLGKSLGLGTGIVTNDTLTGATPSAFYAHVDDRGESEEIAAELVADLPTVALGGGYADFEANLGAIDAQVVTSADGLALAADDGRPLLGLFAPTTFPYLFEGYGPELPSLETMTVAAIAWLEDDPEGFLLVVEGARIDHASHMNEGDDVHLETAAFDEAIAAAIAWADASGREVTIVVTADHECGGLEVSGGGTAGLNPDSAWRWGKHTNADVPVYATGPNTSVFDGSRLENTWVYEVLAASVEQRSVEPPETMLIADGYTGELGYPVAFQTWPTSFGAGYNQLDALRVTSDEDGLWIGVDGVFERGENTAMILIDLDYGAGTGLGADTPLSDPVGQLDLAFAGLSASADLSGLGFDVAVGSIGAEETGEPDLLDFAGLRGLRGDFGDPADLSWLTSVSNFDHGNIAEDAAAPDAGSTGATSGGWENHVLWRSLYPTGLPADGVSIAIVALLVSADGTFASNQALPPFAAADEPGNAEVSIASVVALTVDSGGVVVIAPAVVP